MPSANQVTARQILLAVLSYRHQQSQAFERLEQREPQLSEFVFESLTHVNAEITKLGARASTSRRVYQHVQEIVFVVANACLEARQPDDTA
ncbi:MAG: hypothetical protein GC159_10935 [Phycisphaera sp.]|nr:hypothetical protein [Phycisphaera sp.]